MFNIAILTSGHSRGSNLRAIVKYIRDNNLPVNIAFVIRTLVDAPVAEVCDEYNLTCHHLSTKDMDRFEEKVKHLTDYHNVHLIALTGFLKCLSAEFVETVGVPILNIHPALLPKYGGKGMYGMAVHRAVLAADEQVSGATIHLVNAHYDEGKIIAKQHVDVSACKTMEEIASAVLAVEHALYAKTIWEYLQRHYVRKRAALATLGCKVNQVETSSIIDQLIQRGYEIVEMDVPADIYIINTCTVTNRTDFKSRNLIRQALQAKTLNPAAKVIVTGCYAQREKAEIEALGEIDLVLDNNSKVDLDVWFDNAEYKFADIMQAQNFVWKKSVEQNTHGTELPKASQQDQHPALHSTQGNVLRDSSRNSTKSQDESWGTDKQDQHPALQSTQGNVLRDLSRNSTKSQDESWGTDKQDRHPALPADIGFYAAKRTRAFLKIQDGCDFYCTYCAVPYGRGHSRSMAFDDALLAATTLVSKGYQEIVLTGINIGLYGDSVRGDDLARHSRIGWEQKRLADVLKAMVKIDGLKLLRLSSIEPQLWTAELLETIQMSPIICPHYHIPLQSGSDTVLERMGRHYPVVEVIALVWKLIGSRPDAAIGLDVICGFPGETDYEFEETYSLINSLPIAYLHVFGFSKRRGTPAATMKNQIHGSVTKARVQRLLDLSTQKKQSYEAMLIDKQTVLRGIIEKVEAEFGTALSDHYIRIYGKAKGLRVNDYVQWHVAGSFADGLVNRD